MENGAFESPSTTVANFTLDLVFWFVLRDLFVHQNRTSGQIQICVYRICLYTKVLLLHYSSEFFCADMYSFSTFSSILSCPHIFRILSSYKDPFSFLFFYYSCVVRKSLACFVKLRWFLYPPQYVFHLYQVIFFMRLLLKLQHDIHLISSLLYFFL